MRSGCFTYDFTSEQNLSYIVVHPNFIVCFAVLKKKIQLNSIGRASAKAAGDYYGRNLFLAVIRHCFCVVAGRQTVRTFTFRPADGQQQQQSNYCSQVKPKQKLLQQY